jgi:hypothetical protein
MNGSILVTLLCLAPPTGDVTPDDRPGTPPAADPAEATTPPADAPKNEAPAWSELAPPSDDEAEAPREPRDARAPVDETPPPSDDEPPLPETRAEPQTDAEPPAAVVREQARSRPDRPIRYRLDLQLDGGTHVVPHGSFDAFSDGPNLAGLGVGVRADVRLAGGRFFLGGGLAYRRYSSSRDAFDFLLTNEVRVQEPLVFVRLSLMALEGVDVYLEPGGGPTIVDLQVDASRSAHQRAVTGMFNGLAGVALYLPKAWLPRKGASRITAGLDLGLGYGWRGSIALQPSPDTDDEPLSTSSVPFGDLALRGFIWRAGLFVRFM